MKIRYFSRVNNPKYLAGIKSLLALCDKEFVPPLSCRNSTTQRNLGEQTDGDDNVDAYFDEIKNQSALVVIDDGEVIAFASFKFDYVCEHISDRYLPNIYVTTIIVHPKHRNKHLAGEIYRVLKRRFPNKFIFTRTWSTNLSHIRILLSDGFHEHCVLDNDRGANIDTNYYCYVPEKHFVRQYIEQYRLKGNIFFGSLLLLMTVLFLLVWFLTGNGLMHELSLAIATSLMASVLCLFSDTILKIRESKNDSYISKLKSYGIENLQFNKNELLELIIPRCREELWISGCRLVMTGKNTFREAMTTACKRSKNLNIKLLAAPPWSTAYKLIYGEEDTSLNYMYVLGDLAHCVKNHGCFLEVRFSEKPLFSDTYKVDERFITGPYLHCTDNDNNRITAKDFFSLDITSSETELYKLFYRDYMTLWNECEYSLDVDLFYDTIKDIPDFSKMSTEERIELIRSCLRAC